MSWRRLVVFLALAALVGCTGGPRSVPVEPAEHTAAEEIKMGLQDLAETGQFAPGMETIGEHIEKLKATDAEKGEALQKDWGELRGLTDSAAIKAKAKEMLGKL